MKVVGEKNSIIKPVLWARSKNKYNEGDDGEFSSSGWKMTGTVQSIRMFGDERFISSDGMYVYQIYKYKEVEWVGLEMTEEEQIKYDKQQEKKRQLKFRL